MKRIYTILLFCVITLTAWSQEMAHVLIVELRDGTSAKFALTDKPVISHSGNDVLIKSDWLSATYSIDAVRKYRFKEQDITGIEAAEAEEQFTVVYTDGETVRIGGAGDKTRASVFAIDGRKVAAEVGNDGNMLSVSLINLPSGVYIVNVNGKQSFKVVRK